MENLRFGDCGGGRWGLRHDSRESCEGQLRNPCGPLFLNGKGNQRRGSVVNKLALTDVTLNHFVNTVNKLELTDVTLKHFVNTVNKLDLTDVTLNHFVNTQWIN